MSDIFSNSIWPNGIKTDSENYAVFYSLGQNKITIPINAEDWPNGTKLISPFVYDENDKLVGFVDTKAMTVSGSATTTMNYSHIEADFSSISEGSLTIDAPNATVKKFTWAVSTGGSETFDFVIIDFNTTNQETINTVRTAKRVVNNKLYDADDNLIGTIDTSKIEVGGIFDLEVAKIDGLFCNLDLIAGGNRGLILSEFDSDLSSLRDGSAMFFRCSQLESFTSNLSNLTDGGYMFQECASLTSFNADLSSLTVGEAMFWVCSTLTSFASDLPNLTNGDAMFSNCKLDAPSVKNIIDTINTYSEKLALGMGCNNTTEDKNLFAQEVGYTDMTSLLAALQAKGWTVTAQYNGRPTTTYGLRRTTENTLPVFVKLEETEDHADYTSMDGSKKYRLDWFHETTGSTEGYTQFASLEEAIETLNIKPIERN